MGKHNYGNKYYKIYELGLKNTILTNGAKNLYFPVWGKEPK